MHAVADSRQLSRINAALIGFAAVHAAVSLALIKFGGAVGVRRPHERSVCTARRHRRVVTVDVISCVMRRLGLIAADGFNMAIRIGYSGRFIATATQPSGAAAMLRASLPTTRSAVALLLAFVVTGTSLLLAAVRQLTDPMPSLSVSCSFTDFSETITLGRGHILPTRWHSMHDIKPAGQLAAHICTGAICLAAVLLNLYEAERQSFTDAFTVLRRRDGEQKAD